MLLTLAVALSVHVAPPPPTPSPATVTSAPGRIELVPERLRPAFDAALAKAGANADELKRSVTAVPPEMVPGMAFLIATMPERDLTTLSADFLARNVTLAYEAWRGAPWGSEISEATFFQYVLPYVNLNERRDDWRGDFVKRFQAEAWKHPDRTSAVRWLNDHLNDSLNVHYHASKRKKPDQSPMESIELGFASCTGLSILLVDACRACGIPARCVGCPAWKVVQGNHTWVEAFCNDDGGSGGQLGGQRAGQSGERWFNIGDTGSDPRGENWVNERCRAETDPDDWAHAVYAASWRRTGKHFPLPWEWEIDYVPALNVTRFYTAPIDVEVPIAAGPATVEAHWNGELVARRRVPEGAASATLRLARGEKFSIAITYANGTREERSIAP